MSDSLWTFAFEIANFLALTALLAWLFFKPVRKAIHDERQAIQDQFELANQQLKEAEQLKAAIETRQQHLTRDLENLRAKTQKAAQLESDRILASGREQLRQERASLQREALTLSQAQTNRLAAVVTGVAQKLVERLLMQAHGPQLDQLLWDAAFDELQKAPAGGNVPLRVESATPLSEPQQQQITRLFPNSMDKIEFTVRRELGGGVRIQTDQGLIDASILGLSTYCEQEMQNQIDKLMAESIDHEESI